VKDDLVVDDLRAAAGKKVKGYVTVDESASGTVVRVPVILINGAKEGPTFLVTSGIHGDDLNTIPMVWRITQTIDPDELRGQFIGVPVCNPLAFEAGSHLTPADNKTPSFPGNVVGTISERIGYQLHQKLVLKADYLMDMHGGSPRSTLAVLVLVDELAPPEILEKTKAMAEAFNPDMIVLSKPKGGGPPRGMFQVASRNGCPGLLVGMGKSGFVEEDTIRGTRGVLNVLRHLDMLDGEPEIVATSRYAASEVYHRTPFGGGFFPAVVAGEEVQEGQSLGQVYDVFGDLVGEVNAEVRGLVLAIRLYPVISAGDQIASIVPL
jgi:predicted deacylase